MSLIAHLFTKNTEESEAGCQPKDYPDIYYYITYNNIFQHQAPECPGVRAGGRVFKDFYVRVKHL